MCADGKKQVIGLSVGPERCRLSPPVGKWRRDGEQPWDELECALCSVEACVAVGVELNFSE